jgi:predicted SAM-dependent methyltransferase
MKLHLGCGKLKLEDYINIDIKSEIADLKLDFMDLTIFNNETVDEIYISHSLEHIKRDKIIFFIIELNRILKKNGILRISVPDFEKVVKIYNNSKDLSQLIGFLNGGQKDDYDIHYINFDFNILKELLEIVGYKNVTRYDCENFLKNKDDYSKAYLPHMDKNGELMSLNVICEKKNYKLLKNIEFSTKIKKMFKI